MRTLKFNENADRALLAAQEGILERGNAVMEVSIGTFDGINYKLVAEPDAESWAGNVGYANRPCLLDDANPPTEDSGTSDT